MQIFDTTKSLIENIYLISGPVLAILGLAVFLQIRLTKRALVITSKRQAAELAAKQVDYYIEKIIPMQNEYFSHSVKEKWDEVKLEQGAFDPAYVKSKLGDKNALDLLLQRTSGLTKFLNVVNAMDAFSIYFIKEIADEEIAYSAVGSTFCFSVESLYFEIAMFSKEEDDCFLNLKELYRIWSAKKKKLKLSKENMRIIAEMSQIKESKINPLGTK